MNAFYIDNITGLGDSAARPKDSLKRLAVSSLIGDTIFNPGGENLGKIKDIIIDLSKGSIDYIVIESGGFLGMNQKYLAVPADALTIAKEHKNAFILNESKESLKGYPTFDLDHLPETSGTHLQKA
ncbi:MAG TPA: PRC-barrel domain-containing protein [Chryseosolibacter sp.]